jgi:clathrin heavy chain
MQKPLNVNQKFFNLTSQANVALDYIQFNNIGLSSERCITINEKKTQSSELVTVDLQTFEIQRKANSADAVLPHPTRNWNAVRAKTPNNPSTNTVIVYDMSNKDKVSISLVPDHIKFWTWVNDNLLAVLTNTVIYHISFEGVTGINNQITPVSVFNREGDMTGQNGPVQVLGYSVDTESGFAFLVALGKINNEFGGLIQLTSLALKKSQFLKGFSAAFGKTKIHDNINYSQLFAYIEQTGLSGKLTISEIGKPPTGFNKFKTEVEVVFPEGHESDFPIFMTFQNDLGLIFLLTKFGILFVFEASEGSLLLRSKISENHLLTGCNNLNSKGCLLVSKSGDLIHISVEEQAMVNFIKNSTHIKNNTNVAQKLALRAGLPGSEGFYVEQFSSKFISQDFDGAAKIVASSPGTVLRNIDTINKFRNLPKPSQGPHPILKFFFVLLESGKLNEIESKEICALVLAQNKSAMVEKWLGENKLTLSESLGDIVSTYDEKLALKIYQGCNSKKVMMMKLKMGELDSVMGMANPDDLLNQLKTMVSTDPQGALSFANALAKSNKLGFSPMAEVFLNNNAINQLTAFSLQNMPDNPDMDNWQTLILELNLKNNPSVAETIFQTGKWNRFNKTRIAPLCEQKGLYLRALENYQDLKNIKRILLNNAQMIPPEYLKAYIVSKLPAEHIPSVLSDILKFNRNTKLAVEISQEVHSKVGLKELVDVFEAVGSYDAIYFFLGPLLEQTKDSKVYHKYLEACVKCNQLREAEKVIQNCGEFYDPEKVLDLFLSVKLADPKALVILCDKNGYVKEMVRYLWENQFNSYIEIYVIKVNQSNSGLVLGTLMDLGAEENYIRQLLNTIGSNCQIDSLVQEFEKRNRERLLETWLEQRANEGNTLPSIHNALAKIAIDFDKSPEKFLSENRFYDVKTIGRYAEQRDPHLAFTAFNRDPGTCDEEILDLTNKNNLYRLQAHYLVERQNKELWDLALREDNPHRPALVEQVVSTALPESNQVEEVSVTVQAFMQANMPEELLGLLEKIVLHSNKFSGFKKLQNLLIITAMKTDKSRVMDYINRLDNYDGAEIARSALDDAYQLYEEAFVVYKKINQPVDAIKVLLNYLNTLDRAAEFAEKTNLPDVWTELAVAYMNHEQFNEAVDCFVKAKNPSFYEEIIELSRKSNNHEKLLEYFDMARIKKKDMVIDNEYINCLAKLNQLERIESFLKGSNSADLARTGDKLFNEGQYEAAKILFMKLKSNSKIASCLVNLSQYQQAIEFAKLANNVKTWKEIVFACVEVKEFKLAAVAGVQVVLIPDHLEEMVEFYELHDEAEEVIKLLEQTVSNEKSHVGIFTHLASLYAKYKEEKLFDFIKTFFQKLNVSKLIRTCKKYLLWNEVVYLHSNYKEYDNAVKVMMEHSPLCYSHEYFINNLLKVANSDLIYRAISFYIDEEPMRLNELLRQMTLKLDFSKVVSIVKRSGFMPLIVDWLKTVQNQNNQAVNDALNEIYMEMEDYSALRDSIMNYDSFDALKLAEQIQGSEHPEFRRISSLIYRKNKRYEESIELSITDQHYRDAVETAQESQNSEIVKKLLQFFAQHQLREFFSVTTYTCYDLLPPDYVLEMAWRYGLHDFAMPFMIQLVKDLSNKVETVQKKHEEREKKEEEKQERDAKKPLDIGLLGPGLNGPLAFGNDTPMLMNSSHQQANYNVLPGSNLNTTGFGNSMNTTGMSGMTGFGNTGGPGFGNTGFGSF